MSKPFVIEQDDLHAFRFRPASSLLGHSPVVAVDFDSATISVSPPQRILLQMIGPLPLVGINGVSALGGSKDAVVLDYGDDERRALVSYDSCEEAATAAALLGMRLGVSAYLVSGRTLADVENRRYTPLPTEQASLGEIDTSALGNTVSKLVADAWQDLERPKQLSESSPAEPAPDKRGTPCEPDWSRFDSTFAQARMGSQEGARIVELRDELLYLQPTAREVWAVIGVAFGLFWFPQLLLLWAFFGKLGLVFSVLVFVTLSASLLRPVFQSFLRLYRFDRREHILETYRKTLGGKTYLLGSVSTAGTVGILLHRLKLQTPGISSFGSWTLYLVYEDASLQTVSKLGMSPEFPKKVATRLASFLGLPLRDAVNSYQPEEYAQLLFGKDAT